MLKVEGEVERPLQLRFEDLAALPAEHQIADISQIAPKRQGSAVRLAGLLQLVGAKVSAQYLGLHSAADDFHASIPLAAVQDRALVIYGLHGAPLPAQSGGPVRFYIPDFAACHTAEIDECANVKFVDRMELTAAKGFDNRPHDGTEHAALHAKEAKT